ncbi:MAG: ATP-binding protein [Fibrobacterota bacterium]
MKRSLYSELLLWKNASVRKPLVLRGTRQTGKTFLLQLFGHNEFRKSHYLNFQLDKKAHSIFEENLSPESIIAKLEFHLATRFEQDTDLLILDEIQDCPRALTSLKFFYEQMPKLAVCCAGSLLGVVHSKEPFPVGKVTFLNLWPLSFGEFLLERDPRAYNAWSTISKGVPIPEIIHNALMERLREYYVVGGMPEAVKTYCAHLDNPLSAFEQVRSLQQDLLTSFISDFSKYSHSVYAQEIVSIFESIPSQLAKENKKFKPSVVAAKSRFSSLKNAIDWLTGAGLANKVMITNSGEIPFSAFTEENKFKLYLFDTGLLGALAHIPIQSFITPSDLFATFKGAFCENFVSQEFTCATSVPLYCYTNNTSEIEFLREINGQVYPIEVKAGQSGKLKSLNVFASKYRIPCRVRFSARNLEINEQAQMHSYPLYLAGRFPLV